MLARVGSDLKALWGRRCCQAHTCCWRVHFLAVLGTELPVSLVAVGPVSSVFVFSCGPLHPQSTTARGVSCTHMISLNSSSATRWKTLSIVRAHVPIWIISLPLTSTALLFNNMVGGVIPHIHGFWGLGPTWVLGIRVVGKRYPGGPDSTRGQHRARATKRLPRYESVRRWFLHLSSEHLLTQRVPPHPDPVESLVRTWEREQVPTMGTSQKTRRRSAAGKLGFSSSEMGWNSFKDETFKMEKFISWIPVT